jgi:hypothetical protein
MKLLGVFAMVLKAGNGPGSGAVPHIGVPDTIFQNCIFDLKRPAEIAAQLGISVKTIYDWRYRQRELNVPQDLFVKFNRFLYLKLSVLKNWIASQNQ